MTKTRPTTAPTPAESGEYDWAHRATAEYARIYLKDSSPEHIALERQRMYNVMVQFGPHPKQLTARELALTKERDELKADLEDERHRAIVLRDMLEAPAPAVAQGETPRTNRLRDSVLDAFSRFHKGQIYLEDFAEFVRLAFNDAAHIESELNAAKAERDQARQDLEERCAENDRERAARLQTYQEACKERDGARASYRARDNIGMSREEYHKAKKALEENETLRVHLASERQAKIERGDMFIELQAQYAAAESELAELRLDRELLDCVDSSTEIQVIGGRNEFDQPFWIAQHRRKTPTIDCAGKSARGAIRCLMNRLAAIDAARNQQ